MAAPMADPTAVTSDVAAAKQLQSLGYVVLTVAASDNAAKRASMREALSREVDNFPEYAEHDIHQLVMGGFAALANPASFHNMTVRELRRLAHERVRPWAACLAKELAPTGAAVWNFEQIIDRLMIRNPGTAPSAEAWHRDESPSACEGDVILGGWWNLDDAQNTFTCVPGTHKDLHGDGGFAKINDKALISQYAERAAKVAVPPGSILLFRANIVHCIEPTKLKYMSYRLFTGWRLTRKSTCLDAELPQRLKHQAIIKIKSDQLPPMYATLHLVNWRPRLVEFAKVLKEACQEDYTVKTGPQAGTTMRIPQRFLKSLSEYGFALYPEYTQAELAMHSPQPL